MKKEIWSRSIREEIISALWLIAGLLAWQADIKWLAWLLFAKSAFDSLISCVFAVLETKAELMALRNPPNDKRCEPATKGL